MAKVGELSQNSLVLKMSKVWTFKIHNYNTSSCVYSKLKFLQENPPPGCTNFICLLEDYKETFYLWKPFCKSLLHINTVESNVQCGPNMLMSPPLLTSTGVISVQLVDSALFFDFVSEYIHLSKLKEARESRRYFECCYFPQPRLFISRLLV